MRFTIETEQETDGRWLGEIPELPGTLAYGSTQEEAIAKAKALVLHVLADQLSMGKLLPTSTTSLLPLREFMAKYESPSSTGGSSQGWSIKRERGSLRTLQREGWPDFVFAFHDNEEIGPRMLGRISRRTGLSPNDL